MISGPLNTAVPMRSPRGNPGLLDDVTRTRPLSAVCSGATLLVTGDKVGAVYDTQNTSLCAYNDTPFPSVVTGNSVRRLLHFRVGRQRRGVCRRFNHATDIGSYLGSSSVSRLHTTVCVFRVRSSCTRKSKRPSSNACSVNFGGGDWNHTRIGPKLRWCASSDVTSWNSEFRGAFLLHLPT